MTAIEVYTNDPDRIDEFRKLVGEAAARPIYMIDWRQRNATFFNALQVERNVMFLILTLIVLVAALNIVSGLIMLVKDKGSDIAILRTMGASQGSIMRIFLITGSSIGVVGTLAGFLLGTVVCLNIDSIRRFLSWLTHTDLFTPELYFCQTAGRHECARDHRRRGDGAWVVVAGDPLSVLARGPARSGRSASLRVIRRNGRDPIRPRDAAMKHPSLSARHQPQYRQGDSTLDILKGAELAVWAGQSVALVAPSGAGKSTLLHIAGLLEHPDAGEVFVDGIADLAAVGWRTHPDPAQRVGFVYQFHHLLPEFTALENVMLPQMIRGLKRSEASAARHGNP